MSIGKNNLMEKIISLSKRRGFVFPSSEIYGGLSAAYDYAPYGVELLKNIKDSWWQTMVRTRGDVFGLDTAIFMNPKVWEASGHTEHFTDPLMDCKQCKKRYRADKLVEDKLRELGENFKEVDFSSNKAIRKAIDNFKIVCPNCGAENWTEIRDFNTLFETYQGVIKDRKNIIYLRGEIAQGMFVQYKNILNSIRPKVPFGIAQSGKAFRNEITVKHFIFRTREFNLAEIEYFVEPKTADKYFKEWKKSIFNWYVNDLKIKKENLSWREQTKNERAHYSAGTFDLEFKYPWGFDELAAVANRTDYDLKNHQKKSKVNMEYYNSITNQKFIPYVIEPTFGMDRTFLTVLCNAFTEERVGEGKRIVMRFDKKIAPIKIAVFPLLKNRSELVEKAKKIYNILKLKYMCEFDDNGNIGKRYRRQDEIGTPYCITVDFETLKNDTVTVRDRDTMEQRRIKIGGLEDFFKKI